MKPVPTLYEWLGGLPALETLTKRFYERVKTDALLAPVFARMGADHPRHVALFLAEVLGGPTTYSTEHGGHPHMIGRQDRDDAGCHLRERHQCESTAVGRRGVLESH